MCALGDFLVLFAPVLRQIARYLPHHRSGNASKTHPKSSHDKFKTASKMVDLSLIGETVLDWNEEDMNIYHKKRLEVDSLLSLFKSSYRSERIDSVCRLLAEKENLLNKK